MTRDGESKDAGAVWWDENAGVWVYRASGLGNCLGALVRMRMGVDGDDAPEWLQEKWAEGNQHEDEIIRWVNDNTAWRVLTHGELVIAGYTLDALGQVELELKIPGGAVVRCHPDGIVRNVETDEVAALEVKAVSESFAKTIDKELPPFYAWQVAVEVAGLRVKRCLFVAGIKDNTGTELTSVHPKLIDPPYTRADIIKRVREVERLADADEVPFCEYAQYPCAFWTDHDVDNDPLWRDKVVELEDESVEKELEGWVKIYDAMKEGEKECKDDKANAAKEIARILDTLKLKGGKVKAGGYVVTDVVQQRKGAIAAEQLLKDKGVEVDEGELDKYRVHYEVRYPMMKEVE